MSNSKRRCAACKAYFKPTREFPGTVAWCSDTCGTALAFKRLPAARAKIQREARAKHRERKEAVKTRSQWLKEAQSAVNAYVRQRDSHLPCVSCGRFHDGQYHAGHYRSVGSAPELRFNTHNIWRQCAQCNSHLSGNLIKYRAELINRIGLELLDWLEGPHKAKHYSIDDLKAIKAEYKDKLKALKAQRSES